MRKYLILLTLLLPTAAFGVTWTSTVENSTGDFTATTATSTVDETPAKLNATLSEVRFRAEVEHSWGNAYGAEDNGLHRVGSARCYVGTTAPSDLDDSHADAVALDDYDSTSTASGSGVSTFTVAASNTTGNPEDFIGHGRCWLDTDGPDGSAGTADDDTFYVWDGNQGSGEWVIASTDDVDIHLPPKNLLPSGGWSATDGDGDTSGTGVPIGWSLSSTPTIGYSSSDTSEGDTLELNITATGSTNEGISYTLKGLLPSTTYQVYARAHANTAGNTCSIRTTGADTTQVDETTAGVAAFEELEGTFTVDSTPTDVVIILENDTNDAAVCDFTHVAVWKERNVALTEPGVSVSKDEAHVATDGNACSTSYTGNCLNIVNIDVTPPSDGYNVIVIAQVGAASTDSNGVCAARIYDDSAAAAVTEIVFEPELAATPTMIYMSPFPLTAGVTVNYKVDMKEGGSGGDNCRFQDDISSDTVTTSINAILIPSN